MSCRRLVRVAALLVLAPLTHSGDECSMRTPPRQYSISSARIVLTQHGCYGECPVYTIELTGAGTGRYVGQRFVARCGVVEFDFSTAEFFNLLKQLYQIEFFHKKPSYVGEEWVELDEYGMVGTATITADDIPTTEIAVAIGEAYRKSIVFEERWPPDLRELTQRIRDVSRIRQWVGADGGDHQALPCDIHGIAEP